MLQRRQSQSPTEVLELLARAGDGLTAILTSQDEEFAGWKTSCVEALELFEQHPIQ